MLFCRIESETYVEDGGPPKRDTSEIKGPFTHAMSVPVHQVIIERNLRCATALFTVHGHFLEGENTLESIDEVVGFPLVSIYLLFALTLNRVMITSYNHQNEMHAAKQLERHGYRCRLKVCVLTACGRRVS